MVQTETRVAHEGVCDNEERVGRRRDEYEDLWTHYISHEGNK